MWHGALTKVLLALDLDVALDDAVTRYDVMGFLLLVREALLPERPVLSL
jgi:hypothetical protein